MPNYPIVNAGLLYVNGLGISKTAAKVVTMQLGASRDSTNTNDIILGPTASQPVLSPVAINGAFVGANGVDVAVLADSSFYAVYVIGDSTDYQTPAGLLSLNATTPALPFGYDMYRRVGWVLTDSSADILQFWQFGSGSGRIYYYDVGISALSAGTSTTYAAINLSTSVPPIATQVIFKVDYTANSATDIASFLPYGSTATNGIVVFGYGAAAAQQGMATVPCELDAGVPTIQYKVTSGSDSLTLLTAGFNDYL